MGALSPPRSRHAALRTLELITWIGALLALTAWAVLQVNAWRSTRQELNRFAGARSAATAGVAPSRSFADNTPDFHLWSPHAVQAWRNAQGVQAAPLGVLRIARLHIEAPILEGTDDRTLDRGVGHIEDTAAPGAPGNSGIAGHRDSFFRALKDIAVGETLEMETLGGVATYSVDRTWIVEPEDVSVLDPTPVPALTLVTCYPFYFVGSAPQRFIVRATLVSQSAEKR